MAIELTASDTQAAIAATVEALLADRYDFETRRTAVAAGTGHSPPFWAMLAELGLLGTESPEAAGGIGGGFAETAVVLQAFGRALVVEPFVPTVVLGLGLLDSRKHAAIIGDVVAGKLRLALAHDVDAACDAVVASRTDSGWHLKGRKTAVLGGNVADLVLVSATTPTGVSLFLVPADTAGVERHGYTLYDASGAADLTIDATIPATALLGTDGGAQTALDLALDRGAAAAVHEAVGAMERLCAITPEYLKTRVQFGQPLARFQVLQHRMVDMAIALEEARSMALLATAALDDPDPAARARDVSAAKVKAGEAARLVGQTAVQLHGGIALTADYAAGHYFKRLTLLARQFGDDLYHLDRYVGLAT